MSKTSNRIAIMSFLKAHRGEYFNSHELAKEIGAPMSTTSAVLTKLYRERRIDRKDRRIISDTTARWVTQRTYCAAQPALVTPPPKTPAAPAPAPQRDEDADTYAEFLEYKEFVKFKAMRNKFSKT
jgi:hypothetical protein